jgi:translocation and assembly module TamB
METALLERTKPVVRYAAWGLGALLIVVIAGALIVVHADWFRNYVRRQIITATEEATGGKVDIASFDFDVSHMRAVVTDFVLHGTEPAGAPPFVRIARLQLEFLLFTNIHHILDITYLGVEKPQIAVMQFPDGRTNIPAPKTKSTSDKTPLQTVVDLAVGRFELKNGLATLDARQQPLNVQANNLRAQLNFNTLKQAYQGQLDLEPVYVVAGRNTPVTFRLKLPVAVERDRIDFHGVTVTTPLSAISIDGSVANLNDPRVDAHVNGHLALADVQSLANTPLDLNAKNVPAELQLDANASAGNNVIDVTGLRATLGQSNIEASGRLKDSTGNAAMQFKTQLALGELGRLAKVAQRPEGMLIANGTARLDAANNYDVRGNVEARNVAFQQGKQKVSGINLVSAMHVDPKNIELTGLKLEALGGEFDGNVALADLKRYKVQGNLRQLDTLTVARALGQNIPYDGVVSGPLEAEGDIAVAGTKSVVANAHLTIVPGKRGVPLSGKLNADYKGTADDVIVENSFLALPHSRLNVSGSARNRLNIALTTSNLNDFASGTPVSLNRPATFAGTVTGGLSTPHIAGHVAVNQFSVEGRTFDAFSADLAATSNSASVSNGLLTRSTLLASFNANVGLRNWAAPPRSPVAANVSVTGGDLADVAALAGQAPAGYSGALTAMVQIGGTVGNPTGSANLKIAKGMLDNQVFDELQAQVNLTDRLVTIPTAYITSGMSRVNLSAEFQHPQDSFTTGSLHARVQSNAIDLSQRTNAAGTVQINADVNARLEPKDFLLTAVTANASGRGLRFEGQNWGDFTANVNTSGRAMNYRVTSDFAGSNILVNGSTQLVRDYPTTADANLSNLPIQRVLAAVKRTDVPARGILSGSAHVTGTYKNPQGSVDMDLSRAVLYNEPLDRIRARVSYLARSIDVPQLEIVAGPSHIDLTAHYDHPEGDLQQGNARFNVSSSHIDLARIHNIQSMRPGLGGIADLSASGAAAIKPAGNSASPRILLSNLNANLSATGIAAQGHNYGDVKLAANSAAGSRLQFALDSNLAGSTIHGQGNADLAGDYPVNAQLTFANVKSTPLQSLFGTVKSGPQDYEAATDGDVSFNGPLLKTGQLNGALHLTKLTFTTLPRPGAGKAITIANQGALVAALDRGVVRIQNAHLAGPQTDLQLTGSASITGGPLNLGVNANTDLAVLQSFDRQIYSSGKLLVAATVRGTMAQPLINGQTTLQNAGFNYTDVPLGISNANGVVAFNGNTARVQNLTADSGGGKLTLSGFAAYAQGVRFSLRANASKVRVRVQEGVSINADADIHLTGTTDSSVLSGTATIDQLTYSTRSDIGSILTRAAPPVQSPTTPSPFLDNMKLDIRVRTSTSLAVQAALAQNLQADADLRVRGTASLPGVLGRITITQGQLVFFGSEYTVDTGSIGFFNPVRIEPILDISLQTQAKGVTVTLRVTGPIDNMKLSYTSDPPLQFQEIVSLLASGKTPTSDPTILANQPQQPAQGFQQMGESAIVSKALADPVASRLQRVFGVTQLKIDPSFTTGSDVPTANLTLQQRITSNLTFTYVSAINDPNSTTIRIEWAFNQQYSAVATRDQNGIFSLNFFYKRQFR